MEILKLINALRKTDNNIETIFMRGGCYQFHLFLKSLHSESLPYIHQDLDHVITRIGGRFYDIKGELNANFIELYSPLKETHLELVQNWSFSKTRMLSVAECPVCEEPIV